MSTATKEFEVQEGSTPEMWYLIKVIFRGQVEGLFYYPTMKEAREAFKQAGYKRT